MNVLENKFEVFPQYIFRKIFTCQNESQMFITVFMRTIIRWYEEKKISSFGFEWQGKKKEGGRRSDNKTRITF